MSKPGGCHSSGISLGDALRLPKRHPAWRRREAQSGSRKKLTCSGHATNSRRRAASLTSFHSLRVGNAGGRLVWNVRTWTAMPREKAQVAQTARPKVPMRRLGADCFVLAMKRGNARGAKGAGHRHLARVNRHREEPDVQWKAAAFARWHEPDDARVSSPVLVQRG